MMIELRNKFIEEMWTSMRPRTSLTHLLDRHDRAEDVDAQIIKHSLLSMVNKNLLISSEKKIFFFIFLNILENNFYMVKRKPPAEKRHYILPVCNMACLNLY